MMKNKSWLLFLGVGLAVAAFGIYSMIFLPAIATSGTGFNWVSYDDEVLDFLAWNFRIQGVLELAIGIIIMVTAVTGFRQQQFWAWYILWVVPLVMTLGSVMMPWMIPLTGLLLVLSVAALVITRPTPASLSPA